jgi:hypothetical protein
MTNSDDLDLDADLVAACDEWASLRLKCDEVIEDYSDHPPESAEAQAIEAQAAPLEAKMAVLESLVTSTRARTLEGVQAKARALEALDIEHYDGDDFRGLLASLLADLKALRG